MMSLEYSFDTSPEYTTFGSIYHDTRDTWATNKAYIYVAFMRDHIQQYIKIDMSRFSPRIDTIYEFDSLHDRQKQATDAPVFFHPNRAGLDISILGQYHNGASIMRFQRREFDFKWQLTLHQIDQISAYTSNC